MPFNARVLQIFIASPGDVLEERETATEVIQRWNDLNARERSLVLLPLRWETHSSPELGSRPQAVINRQVLDQCDLVVGIFWTRLGTPTGVSASGTVEEIERTGNDGKPVMLYFSNSMVEIDKVDLDEYKRLKAFKSQTYPEGLVETYSSLAEFRDKFSRQLAMKIRDLATHDQKEEAEGVTIRKADIDIVFVQSPTDDNYNTTPLRILDKIHLEIITCANENEIPDFEKRDAPVQTTTGSVFVSSSTNRDYIRELVKFYIEQKKYRAV